MTSHVLGACLQLQMICWDTGETRGKQLSQAWVLQAASWVLPRGTETPNAFHLPRHLNGTAFPDGHPQQLSSPQKHLLLPF